MIWVRRCNFVAFEPMLRSHIAIARRLGATEAQIGEIVAFAQVEH